MFSTLLVIVLSFTMGCASQSSDFKTMSKSDKKAELYYDYGTQALVAKNYTKALVNLKQAIEIKEDDSRFHNNLGMAYFFKGDVKKAISHLKRAIDLDESNSDAKNNLAGIYFQKKQFKQAQDIYQVILKDLEYAKQYRVYYNLGLIELKTGDSSKAISYFKKSVSENKSYCPAQFQLGKISYHNHNYHQAASYFENASLGSCSNNPSPYFQEALSLFNLGEKTKALLKFEYVISKFPTSKEAILANRKIKLLSINNYRKNQKLILESKRNSYRKNETTPKKEKEVAPVKALQF